MDVNPGISSPTKGLPPPDSMASLWVIYKIQSYTFVWIQEGRNLGAVHVYLRYFSIQLHLLMYNLIDPNILPTGLTVQRLIFIQRPATTRFCREVTFVEGKSSPPANPCQMENARLPPE
jgi:hypothetical protein